MNININQYLKYLSPLLVAAFLGYFLSTLLFFIFPKKGVDYIINSSKLSYQQSAKNRSTSKTKGIQNRIFLKAIYKKNGAKSWIVLKNKRTGKTHYLKEGEKLEGNTLAKVNNNNVVFTTDEEKFTLQLDVKKTTLQAIINNGEK